MSQADGAEIEVLREWGVVVFFRANRRNRLRAGGQPVAYSGRRWVYLTTCTMPPVVRSEFDASESIFGELGSLGEVLAFMYSSTLLGIM